MEGFGSEIHQVFVKLLDGKHKILNFDATSISVAALKHRIQTLTSIPSDHQLLLFNNSRILHDHITLTLAQSRENSLFQETLGPDSNNQLAQGEDLIRFHSTGLAENPVSCDGLGKFPIVVNLLLRLRGGKGGFGSLLRGAATKAGQKKTNNFDACRDMSGRRLRHVNAEKKLEEWRAEAEERKLEKMAEDFLKKKMKEVLKKGKGNGGDSAEKYVAKYREDSAKCMEEVERSVRESIKGLMDSKRKSGAEGSEHASKRLKIWLGKRKFGDSDSEDLDEDDSDEEEEEGEENEKSVIIDNGSHSDSSKEAEASSGSITGGKVEAGTLDQGSSGSGSEEEDIVAEESLKSEKSLNGSGEDTNGNNMNNPVLGDHNEVVPEVPHKSHSSEADEIVSQQAGISGSEDEVASVAEVPIQEESVSPSENLQPSDKPLNFDMYHSAAELEVLGLERLKSELQARGLKCGGTLQERAARLFLLKATPLEKLPKKLFAKK
ncbi:hypothetical protein CDL12_25315 [Handroanthus impetiginosus]|uniref:Ubiquitin-like domain-containing protein n=1 Tax=Handroanthus impetiginosus TaxID=429701 RepID=A0A2G9GA51_9LAMI|nr:hypothetical protein CDL12_25315 [Handroanthus impetiginosus]